MNIETITQTAFMPLPRKTVINMMYTSNLISETITDALKPFQLSLQQFNVLRILRGQKGNPANLSTIQERMIHKMSNTTRLVDKLINKKLVKREICEENRRKVEITITKNGLDLLKKLDVIIDNTEEKIIQHLNKKETLALNNLLEKLRS